MIGIPLIMNAAVPIAMAITAGITMRTAGSAEPRKMVPAVEGMRMLMSIAGIPAIDIIMKEDITVIIVDVEDSCIQRCSAFGTPHFFLHSSVDFR